ncbi:Elongation factor [Hirschfeldia incana]|nr:Elongation factor [Hirschfeldia incana]
MEEMNQESKQFNAEILSPKREQSPPGGGGHEECVLTSGTNTSEGTLTSVSGGEGVEVDIVEADENNTSTTDEEDPNATEYSSSFSDTSSEEDADMLCNGIAEDADVESHYWDEADLGPAYDSFSSVFHFRKKRLTNHWKSFIRPLMWRSKWLELRIRELESQALEYPKKLESLDQEKLGAANTHPSVLDNGMKSLPYTNPSYKKRAAKRRRKRKKVESTDDIASYMSHHNLFSYIETKRLSSDGMSVAADDFGAAKDPRVDSKDQVDLVDDDSLFDHREGDSVLEEVLWKIELVHSQVLRMKSQVDVVMSKNAARFSSSENLSHLAASSAPSPTVSAGGGDVISFGAIYNSSQHMADYVLEDLMFSSEGVVSSYGDAFQIPDIIESTVGLFADADVTLHHPQIGDSCEDILDNILIRNGVAEEMNGDVMETSSHEEGEKGEEGEGTSVPPLQQLQETEQDHQEDKSLVLQDSVLRSCLASEMLVVPRNKRTRGGERKASSWCKKHLSDPESQ